MANNLLFRNRWDNDNAYTKAFFIAEMKEYGLTEMEVRKAVREVGVNYFFCKTVGLVGERGADYESCGLNCSTYYPRNGKSGCCKHRGFCYLPSKEVYILDIKGKLWKTKK